MAYGNSAVAAIKERLSLVDMVRRFVDLRQMGGRWMGPCPFHQETKPSFSVNESEGFFYCFGCQASGDIFDFYSRINGLEFKETLQQLALEAGVDLKDYGGSGGKGSRMDSEQAKRDKEKKLALEHCHALAAQLYQHNLQNPQGAECREYLARRQLSPDVARTFGLGCSLPQWENLKTFFAKNGISEDLAVSAGLLSRNDKGRTWDRFRGRLMFPIAGLADKVIAFGARALRQEDDPKYLNSSDSDIYKKGDHLYGLVRARKTITQTRRALLTEGYMDVITLHQYGYTNACGVLGTALTPTQVKRLTGFCKRVDLLFDGDGAGRKAALRSAEMLLSRGLDCRVVLLPDGEDVDSLLHARGAEALDHLFESAPTGLDYCFEYLRTDFSPKEIMDWSKRFLSDLANPDLLAFYLPRVSTGLGLAEPQLRESIAYAKQQAVRRPGSYRNGGSGATRQGSSNSSGPAYADDPGPASAGEYGAGPVFAPPPDDAYVQAEQFGNEPYPGLEYRNTPAAPQQVVAGRERQLLSFSIRCPEHLPLLVDKGADVLLTAPWVRELWSKIVGGMGTDIIHQLSETEKRFYTQCRFEKEATQQGEAKELEDICREIEKRHLEGRMQATKEQMRTAGAQEQLDLLRAMQDILKTGTATDIREEQ